MVIKVLVVRTSALGDIVHTIPALKAIEEFQRLNPSIITLDCIVNQGFKGLFTHLHNINQTFEIQDKSFKGLLDLSKTIAQLKYDYIIDFQGLIKTACFSFLSKPKKVFGFAQPREFIASCLYTHKLKINSRDISEHVIRKNLRLADFFLKYICEKHTLQYPDIQSKFLNKSIKLRNTTGQALDKVVLIPCTTWESKHWDFSYWCEIIEFLVINYNSTVYMTGSPKENSILKECISKLSPLIKSKVNLVTDKGLVYLRYFFADANLVIGVDTGPLHLAADVLHESSAHIIGIFGPTAPERNGPYSFDTLSSQDILNKKPSYKKTYRDDKSSIFSVKPEHVKKLIKSYCYLKS